MGCVENPTSPKGWLGHGVTGKDSFGFFWVGSGWWVEKVAHCPCLRVSGESWYVPSNTSICLLYGYVMVLQRHQGEQEHSGVQWADSAEDAQRLADSKCDEYIVYGITWHPGFPGDPGITLDNDGRVAWTAEQGRAIQQELKGGGWGEYDRLPADKITPRERALALADGGERAQLYTERFPPHDAPPGRELWDADSRDSAGWVLPQMPLGFWSKRVHPHLDLGAKRWLMQVFCLLGMQLDGRAVPEICMLVMQFVPVQMMRGIHFTSTAAVSMYVLCIHASFRVCSGVHC